MIAFASLPGHIRILIVSDQPLILAELRQFLATQSGISVLEEDAEPGTVCEVVSRWLPDVLLFDGTTSGGKVLPLLATLKPAISKLPIVLLSWQESRAFVLQAFRVGISGYILSMTGEEHLVHAIQEVHAGRLYLCPRIRALLPEDSSGSVALANASFQREILQKGEKSNIN